MTFVELIILSISLGIDAFIALLAISSTGFDKKRIYFLLSLVIGAFHFIMTTAGGLFYSLLSNIIGNFGGVTAGAILAILGLKMIKEGFVSSKKNKTLTEINLNFAKIVVLGFALSIDALGAGYSLAVISDNSLYTSAACISLFSFVLAYVGSLIGRQCSTWNNRLMHIIGGIVLVALGIKSLF